MGTLIINLNAFAATAVFLATTLSCLPLPAEAQEVLSLPPPCPLLNGLTRPGDDAPPFSFTSTSGATISYPGGVSLPFILMAVDEGTDPGGVLLATDEEEVDRFLALPPPPSGTFAFASYSTGGGARLESVYASRLALLPPGAAAAWRPHLVFAAASIPELRSAGSAVAAMLDAWQSPRLWVTDLSGAVPPLPRVDGFYECFQWPAASGVNYSLYGPVRACDPSGAGGAVPKGALLLVTNITDDTGACPPGVAAAWAQRVAPAAAGAILATEAPAVIGRDCADAFVDDAFSRSSFLRQADGPSPTRLRSKRACPSL